jgi:hypothetical protein
MKGGEEAGPEEFMMKKMALAMALLTVVPMALSADVSKEDLKKLCAAGISDKVILSFVKSNGPLVKLSADDVLELKQVGASNSLLAAVLAIPALEAPPSPVYVPPVSSDLPPPPSTTYVYATTPSYGSPIVDDDFYLTASYSLGYSGYCAPSYGLGYGYWGRPCSGGYYGNRYCGGYANGRFVGSSPACSGSRVVGASSGSSCNAGGRFVGGHSGVSGGHAGGGFGGGHAGGSGHAGGGGHGGHR